jgi:hypothetical protein
LKLRADDPGDHSRARIVRPNCFDRLPRRRRPIEQKVRKSTFLFSKNKILQCSPAILGNRAAPKIFAKQKIEQTTKFA